MCQYPHRKYRYRLKSVDLTELGSGARRYVWMAGFTTCSCLLASPLSPPSVELGPGEAGASHKALQWWMGLKKKTCNPDICIFIVHQASVFMYTQSLVSFLYKCDDYFMFNGFQNVHINAREGLEWLREGLEW